MTSLYRNAALKTRKRPRLYHMKKSEIYDDVESHIPISMYWPASNISSINIRDASCSLANVQKLCAKEGSFSSVLSLQEKTRTRSWTRWRTKPGGSTETVSSWETACRGSAGTVSAAASRLYPAVFVRNLTIRSKADVCQSVTVVLFIFLLMNLT